MEFEKYINSKWYQLFDHLYKFVLINIIWFIVGSLGLGVFTFFPATLTLFILIYSATNQSEFPLIKSFIHVFLKVYFKAQKVFILLVVIGAIIAFDVVFFYQNLMANNTFINTIGLWVMVIFGIIYLFVLIHIIPTMMCFPNLTVLQSIRMSFMMSFKYILHTLLFIASWIGIIALILYKLVLIPLIPTLLMSLMAYFTLKLLIPKYGVFMESKDPILVQDLYPFQSVKE